MRHQRSQQDETGRRQHEGRFGTPLADGRHLGLESVCTLVASAAGLSGRDVRVGTDAFVSKEAEGGLRFEEADDGLEEGTGSFSFCSNSSKRFSRS